MNIIADKAINFKIDSELYKKIKVKVIMKDVSLKDYIINLIKKDLEEDEQK